MSSTHTPIRSDSAGDALTMPASFLERHAEFDELADFITAYFGGDCNGQAESDLIAAVEREPRSLLANLDRQLVRILRECTTDDMAEFCSSATWQNYDSPAKARDWLALLQRTIRGRLTVRATDAPNDAPSLHP